MMEQYLMMLYVTLEQETALKKFFIDQGWAYCKPDLSVTTDKLGSARITTTPDTGDDSETATSVTGKRKARAISKGAPKVKYVKVLTSPMVSQSGTGNVHQNSIEIQNKDVSESENQLHIPANEQLLFHDNTQNEGDDIENADYVVKTERTIGDIVDEYIEEAEIEDVGDDENDDTDMDDNMEVIEGDTENVLDEPEFGTKFNPGKKSHAEDKGHGKKETLQQNTEEDSDKSNDEGSSVVLLKDPNTIFTCKECGRGYSSKTALHRHLKKHSCQFYCKSCSMAFNTADNLECHIQRKHSQQYSCPKCDKSFKHKNSLSVHMESVHSGGPRFPCQWPDCEKSFNRQDILKDHMNIHTGEKPYICQKCNKSYSSKSSLNHHWKACKSNGLPCNFCGRVLSSRSGLADHIQGMHSKRPLSCVCGQVFTWRNNLSKHKKNCAVFCKSTELDNF